MPLIETKGAASAQGFGEFTASASKVYVEDVFSTYLYTGNGSTQTITNGIDLSGKGGMVWTKERSPNARNHFIGDSARDSFRNYLYPNLTNSQSGISASGNDISSISSTGYTLGTDNYTWNNESSSSQVSWTFRKQPKFFDVVTFTADTVGNTNQRISHSLGSIPGIIIVKRTGDTSNWFVYHRSLGRSAYLSLNLTDASTSATDFWGTADPTSTDFGVLCSGSGSRPVVVSGGTYVAYLFAHDAGGFGLSGTDNVISCGSFTTDGSGNATVSLGYEPQWFLRKRTDSTGNWTLVDNMRGFTAGGTNAFLYPNLSNAEVTGGGSERLTSTGVQITGFGASISFIYIAIRRGPMKVPTSGTSVFEPVAYTGNNTAQRQIGSSVLLDALINCNTSADSTSWSQYAQIVFDRLRGDDVSLSTANTAAEVSSWSTYIDFDSNIGWDTGATTTGQGYLNRSSSTYVSYIFRRAPGFFDVVCYTGTGSSPMAQPHNLSVAPELMIFKVRNSASYGWWTMVPGLISDGYGGTGYLQIQSTAAYTATGWTSPIATSSNITIPSNHPAVNASGSTYVAYLFATVAGVSKVFSFTGNGSSQTINCGFTGGSRLVLIKRTDSTGNWVIFDSARGIVAGNDPALYLNSTAAEITGVDAVDTDSTGFIVNQETTFNLNVNNATYIGLAIA